jgi:hypothetical protein
MTSIKFAWSQDAARRKRKNTLFHKKRPAIAKRRLALHSATGEIPQCETGNHDRHQAATAAAHPHSPHRDARMPGV